MKLHMNLINHPTIKRLFNQSLLTHSFMYHVAVIGSENVRDVVLSPMFPPPPPMMMITMTMEAVDIDFPHDVTHFFVNHPLIALQTHSS